MMCKILFINSYYPPEVFSSFHLGEDIRRTFIDNGYCIDIITPVPTRGIDIKVRNKYKKIKHEKEYNGKIKIYRFAMFGEPKSNILRAIRYFLCNNVHFWKGLFIENVDLIYTSSTPPTNGIVASLLKKIKKVPFVYNLQDIFPDSLCNTGITKKDSFVFKMGRKIEDFTYKNADKIIVISQDFKKNIMAKGVPEEKIEVVYNWVDENAVIPIEKENNILFEKFGESRDKFNVVYAGSLGNSQNLEVIIEAALILHEYRNIKFIVIGNGPCEEKVKALAVSKGLKNISFYDLQAYDLVPNVYSMGNASFITCPKNMGKNAMPSKTWSIMSAGTAVLASFDSDSDMNRILKESNAGLLAEANDPEALADNILYLFNNQEICSSMGKNARKYIEDNLTKDICTKKYVDLLKEVIYK